jgi:hypothetical protein
MGATAGTYSLHSIYITLIQKNQYEIKYGNKIFFCKRKICFINSRARLERVKVMRGDGRERGLTLILLLAYFVGSRGEWVRRRRTGVFCILPARNGGFDGNDGLSRGGTEVRICPAQGIAVEIPRTMLAQIPQLRDCGAKSAMTTMA